LADSNSKKPKLSRRLRVGSVFSIALSDNRVAYGWFVRDDSRKGPMIQIFDLILESGEEVDLSRLADAGFMFPPIVTGLKAAIRTGLWKMVGHIPVKGFVPPKFIACYWDEKTGIAYRWFLWDGDKHVNLGDKLPDKYRKLELDIVWDPHAVAERILNGYHPRDLSRLLGE
jgi:hypothetical protein